MRIDYNFDKNQGIYMTPVLTHIMNVNSGPFPLLGIIMPKPGQTLLPGVLRWIGYIPGANIITGIALIILGAYMNTSTENKALCSNMVIRGFATALFGPLTLVADIIAEIAKAYLTSNTERSK